MSQLLSARDHQKDRATAIATQSTTKGGALDRGRSELQGHQRHGQVDSGIQECAVVHGFTNLPTGEKVPIEQHGDVYPGMYIMSINETKASLMSLQQVTQLLGRLARKEKLIRFAVFRPGSPRNRSSMDTASQVSNQRTSITSSSLLPPPVPVATKPPTPSSGLASFSSRFANLAASVMD
ncbi:hypothetical protein PR001_g8855, partial [Phytophthora rubi]